EIRGVAVSTNIIKTLQEREWVRIVGHRDVPGRPAMYATTRQFLDYFNLKSLEDLPPLAEIKDLDNLSGNLPLESLEADVGDAESEIPSVQPEVTGEDPAAPGNPDEEPQLEQDSAPVG
ncbi:MAG: SMC-Scp complex subunit ScpB, partial [Luminiphilus sp.]|nr:SMC-Scp complex subunit ScpB [Luminiphilus sp.]